MFSRGWRKMEKVRAVLYISFYSTHLKTWPGRWFRNTDSSPFRVALPKLYHIWNRKKSLFFESISPNGTPGLWRVNSRRVPRGSWIQEGHLLRTRNRIFFLLNWYKYMDRLVFYQSEFLRRACFTVLQFALYLKVYHRFAPEDGNGAEQWRCFINHSMVFKT